MAVIRALLCKTDIVIADEPTSALDKKNSLKLVEEIKKTKNEDRIIIICTHKDIFDDIADEIINLNYGITENKIIDISNEDFMYVPKKKMGVNNKFLFAFLIGTSILLFI